MITILSKKTFLGVLSDSFRGSKSQHLHIRKHSLELKSRLKTIEITSKFVLHSAVILFFIFELRKIERGISLMNWSNMFVYGTI